jgi:hypothetical protein
MLLSAHVGGPVGTQVFLDPVEPDVARVAEADLAHERERVLAAASAHQPQPEAVAVHVERAEAVVHAVAAVRRSCSAAGTRAFARGPGGFGSSRAGVHVKMDAPVGGVRGCHTRLRAPRAFRSDEEVFSTPCCSATRACSMAVDRQVIAGFLAAFDVASGQRASAHGARSTIG